MSAEDLNSGLYACMASTVRTEATSSCGPAAGRGNPAAQSLAACLLQRKQGERGLLCSESNGGGGGKEAGVGSTGAAGLGAIVRRTLILNLSHKGSQALLCRTSDRFFFFRPQSSKEKIPEFCSQGPRGIETGELFPFDVGSNREQEPPGAALGKGSPVLRKLNRAFSPCD